MSDDPDIEISIQEPAWEQPLSQMNFAEIAQLVQKQTEFSFSTQPGLSLYFINNDEMRELNLRWRQKDKPTNVLSFPITDPDEIDQNSFAPLGELVFSYAIIKQEAAEQKKTFLDHFTHLFIHGYLHLLGFEHEEEKQAELMEGHEIAILSKMGIRNPYE